MKDESVTDDKDEIQNAKIEETLGNMLLVRVNGELKQVAATNKNELLYKHNLFEILNKGDEKSRVVLTDDEDEDNFVAIAPTDNDSVYQIWIDNNPYPVMNPPSKAGDVLRGVKEALETPSSYETIKRVYEDIRSDRVRRFVIQSMESVFSSGEVVPEPDGWNILGIFVLTWDARVFLNTSDRGTAYRVTGSGVSETQDTKQFLQLSIGNETIEEYRGQSVKVSYPLPMDADVSGSPTVDKNCPTCGNNVAHEYIHEGNNALKKQVNDDVNINEDNFETKVYVCTKSKCEQAWQEYSLTEREVEFIAKANWLVNHREKLDDEAFWDVIESYVWYNNG